MEATAYPEAVFPDPPVVFGIQLRPFSAGHRLLLERFVDLEDRHPAQLALAVLLCSGTFKEANALLGRPDVDRIVAKFADHLQWQGWWIFRRPRALDWVAEWNRFVDYVDAGSRMPPVEIDKRGETLSTHDVLSYWVAVGHLHTWEEFLDHPWRLILWEAAALAERKGGCRILAPGEWEARDKQAAFDAAVVEAQAKAAAEAEKGDAGHE